MGPTPLGKGVIHLNKNNVRAHSQVGTLDPLDGMVKRHNHLRIGQYHQHLTELLPMDKSALEYMVGVELNKIPLGFFNA